MATEGKRSHLNEFGIQPRQNVSLAHLANDEIHAVHALYYGFVSHGHKSKSKKAFEVLLA